VILESLLLDAGLTKQQLADKLGVSIKTVYTWSTSPPQYVTVVLEQHIKLNKYTTLIDALKDAVS